MMKNVTMESPMSFSDYRLDLLLHTWTVHLEFGQGVPGNLSEILLIGKVKLRKKRGAL